MRFNKVQVAWYGNKSGMEAVDRASGEVFAQVVSQRRQHRLLLPHHRQHGQPVHQARRHPQVRQDARLRHRRSELDLRLPGADLLHLRGQATSIRRPASRPCATPATRPTPWRSPTSRSTPPPTTARTCSGSRSTAPDAREQIKIIWTSPHHPARSAGLAQGSRSGRQDQALHLPAELRPLRLDEEIKAAQRDPRQPDLVAVHPSSDDQLLPIRKLEANKRPDEGARRRQALRRREGRSRSRRSRPSSPSSTSWRRRPRPIRSRSASRPSSRPTRRRPGRP